MTNDDDELRKNVALFRYGLIADLLHLHGPRCGVYAELDKKAERSYAIPGSTRTQVAAETIRGWLKDYRRGGFEALLPQRRSDAGASRRLPQSVQDVLLTIKEEHEDYTVNLVIQEAQKHPQMPADLVLAPSTVHRLLSRHGLMKKPTATGNKDRRRFEFAHAGDLWMSDVMHGPAVVVEGKRKRKTYLIAFIDDATRIIPYATFAMSESNTDFMPAMKQAILRRGIPCRLFVDNGAAYRSHHLALVMAKLGITLIHARVRHPQAKGKQERWFRRLRTQLLPLIRDKDLTLEALNRKLWAWIEGEYHRTPHRGLDGETPEDRWAAVAEKVRYPGPDLDDLFLFEAKRKVKKDRTVSLDGQAYEVEAVLVDETVTLRFDPADRRVLQVWHEGQRAEDARPLDVRANCIVKRNADRPSIRLTDIEEEEY